MDQAKNSAIPATPPAPRGTVAPAFVRGMLAGALHDGHDAAALLAAVDIDPACLGDDTARVPLADYAALFDHRPDLVAVDAHPGYVATRAGLAMGLPVARVFHHHAHLAACLAENLWPCSGGPVAGIVLDGHRIDGDVIPDLRDGADHSVEVVIGS